MRKVDRHPFTSDVVKNYLEDRLGSLQLDLETASNRPQYFTFTQYFTDVQYYLGYLVASNPVSPRLCWALHLLCNGAQALFAAAATSEETITVVLDDEDGTPVTLLTRGIKEDAGVNYWQAGFYAALLLRQKPALDTLANVSIDLLRNSEIRADECRYLFAGALQGFWKREKDTSARLLAAMKAADPALVDIAPDYVFKIVELDMELLFRILLLEAPAFNETLVEALTNFRAYWGSDQRRTNPMGYIAPGPLAFTALAYDLGIPIEVESEYLPPALYKGACR